MNARGRATDLAAQTSKIYRVGRALNGTLHWALPLAACLLGGCASPDPDVPLVFLVGPQIGSSSCLVALNHMVREPAVESPILAACEKKAKALVLESDIVSKAPFSWAGYKRREGDMGSEDLSPATASKVAAALRAAAYEESEIDYFRTLHPMAIYRALQYSKALSSREQAALRPNIDIQLARQANTRAWPIREAEGMREYYRIEKSASAEQVDQLVSAMCDMYLDSARLENYRRLERTYVEDLSAQPGVETAWEKKRRFNVEALGLPSSTMAMDIDERNPRMAQKMMRYMQSEDVLIFVGAAHIGGPMGLLKIFRDNGLRVERLQ